MISELRIKGFRSIVDCTIELGAVNVFIGANGSGKSNLLEAVGVLGAVAHGSIDREALRYRGVRPGSPVTYQTSLGTDLATAIALEVVSGKIEYAIKLRASQSSGSDWEIQNEAIAVEGVEILHRDRKNSYLIKNGDKESVFWLSDTRDGSSSLARLAVQIWRRGESHENGGDYVVDSWTRTENITNFCTNLMRSLASYSIFYPTTPQLRGSLEDVSQEPLGLGGSGLAKSIEEMLDRSNETLGPFDLEDVFELIEWADGFSFDPVSPAPQVTPDRPAILRFHDRYMRGNNRSISVFESSEGALYVLFMLALIGHKKSPPLFAVDNFDQALHPRLACALTRMVSDQIVKDGGRQMLATTHNPLVLDGLNLLDDRVRLFAVDRDSVGATRVQRVEVTEQLMAEAENGMSLSRLWVMGRLGGVPQSL